MSDRPFQKGEKIVCVDNSQGMFLTIGKWYEVHKTSADSEHIYVKCDDVVIRYLMTSRFRRAEQPAEQQCVAGCKQFTGGDVQHHKDCPNYPESLSQVRDELTQARDTAIAERDAARNESVALLKQWNDLDERTEKKHREWNEQLQAALARAEKAERELRNREEGLASKKASCVDKCGHPAEFICEYEDGSRHCLECEAMKVWKAERERDDETNRANRLCAHIEREAIKLSKFEAMFLKVDNERLKALAQLTEAQGKVSRIFEIMKKEGWAGIEYLKSKIEKPTPPSWPSR